MGTEKHVTERLSEYLDGELDAPDRLDVERHLDVCDGCRTTLADLRAVIARASALPDIGPQRDLWAGVASRIEVAPAIDEGPAIKTTWTFRSTVRKRITFTLPQLAAAALALMVLSGGLVWRARSGDPRADFQPVSASDASASVTAGIDADVARVLDQHLRAIDTAIGECTAAVADHPDDDYLAAHLSRLKAQRVALLRDTADQHSAER